MQAHDTLIKYGFEFQSDKSDNDGLVASDNSRVIEILNDEGVAVEELLGQETWIFGDGSYITRNDDEYWPGDDIDEFRVTAELWEKEHCKTDDEL